MWSPIGQQVMIPTPHQLYKRYGLGTVSYHTSETVVLFRRRKRRREVAELLEVPLHHLMDPTTRREEEWIRDGAPLHVPFFAVDEHKVWGATAIVLAEFLALLNQSRPNPTPAATNVQRETNHYE